jgi:hypothetical protein
MRQPSAVVGRPPVHVTLGEYRADTAQAHDVDATGGNRCQPRLAAGAGTDAPDGQAAHDVSTKGGDTMRQHIYRTLAGAVSVLSIGAVAWSGVDGATTRASASPAHCVDRSRVDLNALWMAEEQIAAAECALIDVGRRFRPSARWELGTSFGSLPEGFEPAGVSPAEDFGAKLDAVRHVIDQGTRDEHTYVISNDGSVRAVPYGPGRLLADTLTLDLIGPLPIGVHTIDTYWVLSEMHCNGLSADGCLAAGETLVASIEVEVTPFDLGPWSPTRS